MTESKDIQPSGLHRKIAEIVAAVDHVEKDGYNRNHSYAFTSEAAFLRAVRGELASRSITVYPAVIAESVRIDPRPAPDKGFITTCVVNYTFTDADTGESFTASVPSQGFDMLDKGLFKAMTGAIKYVLRQTFLLPTGDDPEDSPRPPTAATARHNSGSGPNAVPLPVGIYENGTIAESTVISKNKKSLWLVTVHVPAARGGMVGEAKKWLQLDDARQLDAIEAQAVELGIVDPSELGIKDVAAEVDAFAHNTLAGRSVAVTVEEDGEHKAVSIMAPAAVTA